MVTKGATSLEAGTSSVFAEAKSVATIMGVAISSSTSSHRVKDLIAFFPPASCCLLQRITNNTTYPLFFVTRAESLSSSALLPSITSLAFTPIGSSLSGNHLSLDIPQHPLAAFSSQTVPCEPHRTRASIPLLRAAAYSRHIVSSAVPTT
jgi:hypothetical protein